MIDYYEPALASAQDYYPFGMLMPKRSTAGTFGYRYGFNGKENDNEVKGLGNQQDYGMRIYDPRLGRFLSVDPLTSAYPFYTPYSFAGNQPIRAIDLDGLEEKIVRTPPQGNYNSTALSAMDEFKIKRQLAEQIYKKIDAKIISKSESVNGKRMQRYYDEPEIILSAIFENIRLDAANGYACVVDPDTGEPGIFYRIAKGAINLIAEEIPPVGSKVSGLVLVETGQLFIQIADNVEKYKKLFYKKYFPDKYAAAVEAGLSKTLRSGKLLKKSGKVVVNTGKVLDFFGTAGIWYEVLNPSKGPVTEEELKEDTLKKLKQHIKNNDMNSAPADNDKNTNTKNHNKKNDD